MITCRSFSRFLRAWQLTNPYTTVNHTGLLNLQENLSSPGVSYINIKSVHRSSMGWNKKRKTVLPVWRPVSTQSSSQEECLEGDVMAEPENIGSVEQANSIVSSSSMQVEDTVGEAAGLMAGKTSTCQDEQLKDTEDQLADSLRISTCEVRDDETVSIVSKDKHSVSFEIGASVMRFVKGRDGSTQKGLEEDMGVKLIFPSSKKDDSIVIEGESLDVITRASEKIQAIIDEAVMSPAYQYSHFVSLPLAIHPELVDKLVRFQCTILGDGDTKDEDVAIDDVSSEEDGDEIDQSEKAPDVAVKLKVEDDTNHVNVAINVPLISYAPKTTKSSTLSELGIDKSIFIKPKTFHLTVLMLKLWNKERVRAAVEVLQNVSSKVIEVLENRPVFVRLKGLGCMRGSKADAHVLYAPIEEIGSEDRLSHACQVITEAYVKAGLVLKKDIGQKLKLHATVMNTTHRKRWNRKGKKRSQPFDASGIFEQFGAENWGDYHIREAHLSQRFLYDENGYYHCCASIPFPETASSS